MSTRVPLMPKATAVWLVENTSLSFEQIAELCGLHNLEVKGIADGDVAQGIKGQDPISSGQLSREEIARGEANERHRLRLAEPKYEMPVVKTKRGPRYTPVSRRQDRPNAVLWLLRSHPELKDSQIMRLVGTTKPTIAAIRERTHWNSANLQPQDPVTLGLCSQIDLDAEVKKASKRVVVSGEQPMMPVGERAGTLLPTSTTVPGLGDQPGIDSYPGSDADGDEHAKGARQSDEDQKVFAKLQQLTRPQDEDDQPSDEGLGGDDDDAKGSDTGE
ncbi:MAG: cell cycle transcriptional regulator TrcR [Hyphomicrobiaceae bacterium]